MKPNMGVAIILIISIVVSTLGTCFTAPTFAEDKTLTLEEVLDLGIKNSTRVNDTHKKIFEKKIAIKQAEKSVKDEGLKLLRIFEKKPTFNKDYARKTKVQKAQFELGMANKELVANTASEKYRLESEYMSAYFLQESKKKKELRLSEAKSRLEIGKIQFKKGLTTEDQVKEQEDVVKTLQAEVDDVSTSHHDAMVKIGESIGKDFSKSSYSLTYKTKDIYLPERFLPSILEKGLASDFGLYSATENLKYKSFEINSINSLYNNKFSSGRMGRVNGLVSKGAEDIGDLELMSAYEGLIDSLISKWGDEWKSYYAIPLIFIVIKIPKLFRSGEFDGVRYLEDARYILMLEIFKAKQMISTEKELRKAKATYVTELFSAINNTDYEYTTLKKEYLSLKSKYEIDLKSYSKGLIGEDVLITENKDLQALDDKIFSTYVKLNEKILEMNYLTDGYYGMLAKSDQVINQSIVPAPFKKPSADSMLKEVDSLSSNKKFQGSWTLKPLAEGINGEFKIKVKSEDAILQYQVFNSDGLKLSEKLDAAEGFIHLSVTFSDLSALRIKLYSKENEYDATVSGYGDQGALEVVEK